MRSAVAGVDPLDGREERPLVGIGVEAGIEENGVPLLSWRMLERQRDQVAEPASGKRVLAGEEAIV